MDNPFGKPTSLMDWLASILSPSEAQASTLPIDRAIPFGQQERAEEAWTAPYPFEGYESTYVSTQRRGLEDLTRRMKEYAENPRANPMEMPISFDSGGMFGTFAGKGAKGFQQAEGKFSALFDKKPRFEIDDSAAQLTGQMSGKLGEVLDHPELFKNYPHFKNIDVALKIDPNLPGAIGDVAPSGRIMLSAPSKESLFSELLHEVQHPIQDLEGFAKGANLQTYGYSSSPESVLQAADRLEGKVSFYEDMKKLNNIISEQKRRNVPAAVAEFERKHGYTPALPDKTDFLYQGRTPEQLKQDALYKTRNFLDSIRSNDKINEFIKDNISFYEKDMQEVKKAYKSYKNTAGEIESRDVANRAALNPYERMTTPPYSSEDIPLKDMIVRMGGGQTASSMDLSQKILGYNKFGEPVTQKMVDMATVDMMKGLPVDKDRITAVREVATTK